MMHVITIDTETTGMRDDDEIVEIAAVRSREKFDSCLVRPMRRPLSFGAMATHHITPEMLERGGVQIGEALSRLNMALLPPTVVLVMHNAEYDRKYLPPYLRDLDWICTYRCALHMVPDAESHSNGSLWYELGLAREMPPEAGHMPHRALFDALMTHDILEWMLARMCERLQECGDNSDRDECIRHLVHMTKQPVLLKKVRFGKHSGSLWSEVPLDYLQWCLRQDFDADVKYTCDYWLRNDP